MKRSDTAPDSATGRFVERAKPLGTVTEDMVIKRAKELAIINGRNGNDYTDSDFDQARRELAGLDKPDDGDSDQAPTTGAWLSDAPGPARKTPVRPASDEQQVAEELVREGVEEATHHQLLVGNQETRGKM
jgi:hypothetical protein